MAGNAEVMEEEVQFPR